jgi:hypothetical protein
MQHTQRHSVARMENFIMFKQVVPITVGAVEGMNCLRSLERWDRGFEFHSRHGCLSVFILFVYVAALRRADPPSKKSYRLS